MTVGKPLIRDAMRHFLEQLQKGVGWERRGTLGLKQLPGHPFGLPSLVEQTPVDNLSYVLWINEGADLACAALGYHLRFAVEQPAMKFGFRVIKVPIVDVGNRHGCFFEFATEFYTIIAGTGTDYSETNNLGRITIETIFNGFSELYDRPVESVNLSPKEGVRALSAVDHWLGQST